MIPSQFNTTIIKHIPIMPPSSFRWRTVLELAAIVSALYIFLGAPGLSGSLTSGEKKDAIKPKAHIRPESLVYPDPDLQCPEHGYDVHIYSTKPLVIYIDGFLSHEEADALVDLSAPNWHPSTTFSHGGSHESTDANVRRSDKALLPRPPLVQCIEARALAFQGWPANTFIERLWTQRYNVSGHYAAHYDWSAAGRDARRASSFMVYLRGEGEGCEGGGTEFPMLEGKDRDSGGGWCDFVDCGKGRGGVGGVAFRPRKGSAVFWLNFDGEGRGIRETVHAGLPVTGGVKVGLNIWSWWQRGLEVEDLGEL